MVETIVETPARLTRARSESERSAWRRLAAAFSLASLCYLRVWSELLHRTPRAQFYAEAPPQPVQYAAVLLGVVVLTAIFWMLIRLAQRHARGWLGRAAGVLLALAVLLPLLGLRAIWLRDGTLDSSVISSGVVGRAAPPALKLLLLAVAGALLLRFHRRVVAVLETAALLLAPFALYAGARAAWAMASRQQAPLVASPQAPHNGHATPAAERVVWAIFDEWDAGLSFHRRPAGLKLDEFDRLRAEAIWAANAYPPGGSTPLAVPSLLTGQRVSAARAAGPNNLRIRLADSGKVVDWSSQPNVFQRAHQQGWRSAVVGWHIPYCRLFGPHLAACSTTALATQANSVRGNVWETALGQARSLVETERLSPFGQTLSMRRHIQDYRSMLAEAVQAAARRDLDLVYLHLPVPHGPYVYDASTGRFDVRDSPPPRYLDSLKLADLTWGALRRAIEDAGLWDSTTVLLSSDHSLRGAEHGGFTPDRRAPFLLKLAGQHQGVSYTRPMNTRCSQALLLEVLHGRLRGPAATLQWMDRHCVEPAP